MSRSYIPSDFITKKNDQTIVMNDNYMFMVQGNFIVNGKLDAEGFLTQKIKEDKLNDYHDHDNMIKNFNDLINSKDYSAGYDDSEFYVKVYPKLKCCNTWFELYSFTNTCEKCGSDYNTAGQLLCDRKFWGEETGEHWTECV